MLGNIIYGQLVTANNQPLAAALSLIPLTAVVLCLLAMRRTFAFPPTGLTLRWWRDAWASEGMWRALGNSVLVGLCATAIALVLGTMAAFAVQRYRFFGRQMVNLLVVLPITLPGIVTGIALNATFTSALHVVSGMATVIVGQVTFCIVIVFNNIQARLRRLGTSLEEASSDLGACAWQTFRYVTFPMTRGVVLDHLSSTSASSHSFPVGDFQPFFNDMGRWNVD